MGKHHRESKMLEDSWELFCEICTKRRGINLETLQEVIILAVEIAREGREGRRIGTIFVVSDSVEVLKRSQNLILDPLFGHPEEKKRLTDPDVRETIKELAQLDGAFVISDDGIVLSASRFLDAKSDGIKIPLGFGARHIAAAAITKATKAVGVVVSESSVVRVFDDGELISEIIPELWLFSKFRRHLIERYSERTSENLTVISKAE